MSTRRGLVCVAGALVATAVLVAAAPSMPAPPLAGPGELEDWWTSNGTAVATWGPFSREALEPHKPDFWLESPAAILKLIEN